MEILRRLAISWPLSPDSIIWANCWARGASVRRRSFAVCGPPTRAGHIVEQACAQAGRTPPLRRRHCGPPPQPPKPRRPSPPSRLCPCAHSAEMSLRRQCSFRSGPPSEQERSALGKIHVAEWVKAAASSSRTCGCPSAICEATWDTCTADKFTGILILVKSGYTGSSGQG